MGGGGFFGSNFGGGVNADVSVASVTIKSETAMPIAGGGIYGFFDAGYAELSVGLFFGSGSWETEATSSAGQSQSQKLGDVSTTELDLGLLLKYPVAVSEAMKIFPVVGMDYQACMSAEAEGDKNDEPGDLSRLWVKFGAGADFSLNEKLFIRPALLYGIGLGNTFEKDFGDALKYELAGASAEVKTRLSHGLTVKVGVGMKL